MKKAKIMEKPAHRRRWGWLLGVLIVLIGLTVWIIWGNTALELNTYTVTSDDLPAAFDGYRIAQVSDLHNAQMGENNEKLLDMLRQTSPDMIAITGDIIDCYDTDMDIALAFVEEAVKIAPCYFITGNHEARIAGYFEFRLQMEALGVEVLADERMELEKEGETLLLIGVDDPYFISTDTETVLTDKLRWLVKEDDPYTVLLSHRPTVFDLYVQSGVDLVLSGHLHGGQIRLPFIGGLYTPSTGFFPEYDAGLYTQGDTSMIVSRGIGNSIFPVRVNNRPEVNLIELRQA